MFLRTIFGVDMLPLEYLCVVALCMLVLNRFVYGTKFVSLTHPKTNEVVRVGLGKIVSLPTHLFFNDRVRENEETN